MENVCDTLVKPVLNNTEDMKFHSCKQNVESSNIKKSDIKFTLICYMKQ